MLTQVTVTSPSQPTLTKTLGDSEGDIVESLVNGHVPSIASAIMNVESLQKSVFTCMLQTLNNECNKLSQLTGGA